MKITNHKDGSRSFQFSKEERVCNSKERAEAIGAIASMTGGPFSFLSDFLSSESGKEVEKHGTGLGTTSLITLFKICLSAEKYPLGQRCKEIAKRELEEQGE